MSCEVSCVVGGVREKNGVGIIHHTAKADSYISSVTIYAANFTL